MTVYFIRAGRHVKIGYTAGNPERRLKDLQTANARKLYLLAAIPGGLADEARLHQKFDSDRVTGEWFTLSKPIKRLIRSLRGWTLSIPDQNATFIQELWTAYPDVSRSVTGNAASCREIAEALRDREVGDPERRDQFRDWNEDDVARALAAFGVPTRRMKFWETTEGAWDSVPEGPFVWLEGFELDDALEYFMAEHSTYWDGTKMTAEEIHQYREAARVDRGSRSLAGGRP